VPAPSYNPVVDLSLRLAALKERITAACARAGREPDSVTLVAVTKTHPAETVTAAIRAGITDIGENRIQEAAAKKPLVNLTCRWHLVGSLQTNKVKKALELFDAIQSLDSLRLAEEIERRAAQMARVVPVLIEVNTSGEASKHGVQTADLAPLCAAVLRLPHLRLEGLMTIGPGLAIEDPEASRPCFRLLARLAEETRQKLSIPLPRLSMGMTSDFEVGIEEGATIIRVGTALFGPRA